MNSNEIISKRSEVEELINSFNLERAYLPVEDKKDCLQDIRDEVIELNETIEEYHEAICDILLDALDKQFDVDSFFNELKDVSEFEEVNPKVLYEEELRKKKALREEEQQKQQENEQKSKKAQIIREKQERDFLKSSKEQERLQEERLNQQRIIEEEHEIKIQLRRAEIKIRKAEEKKQLVKSRIITTLITITISGLLSFFTIRYALTFNDIVGDFIFWIGMMIFLMPLVILAKLWNLMK